ncbi:MAG: hypothetical protein Q4C00_00900 [Bacillota bacterium]|nr:hypothetical protein [Bacillota bacterium]
MALLDRFKKKQKPSSVEWPEIKVEEAQTPVSVSQGGKKIDYALKGRLDPLETRQVLSDFIAQGWSGVEQRINPLVFSNSAAPWVMGEIFLAFPQESAVYLERYREIPVKTLWLLLSAVGKGSEKKVNNIVLTLLPNLSPEDIPGALELLGRFPMEEGNEKLASYLTSEDWTLVVKAAAALAQAGAKEYLPQIETAAARGGILQDALKEITERMV